MTKKRKIIILVIVILIVVLIVLGIIASKNKTISDDNYGNATRFVGNYYDPSLVDVTSDEMNANHCVDNICVNISKIKCNNEIGTIYFTIYNNGNDSRTSGYIGLNLGSYTAYIPYNDLDLGDSIESFYVYENANLSSVTDFELELLDDSYSDKFYSE